MDLFAVRRNAAFITDKRGLICLDVGEPVRFDGESAEFARAALAHLRSPQSIQSLARHLEHDAGQQISIGLIESLVAALRAAGVLVPHVAPSTQAPRSLTGVRVVLGVTGAIASTDSPRTVLALQAQGAHVQVALTKTAGRYVSKSALAAFTHAPVRSRLSSADATRPVPHIELAQWAEVVVVAPASATTLGRAAHGDCSDLLSALIIATRAPVLFAPSMNADMWHSASTRRNVELLLRDGHAVLSPQYGIEVADQPAGRKPHFGSILPPDRLVQALSVWLRQRAPDLFRRKIDWDALYGSSESPPWLSDGLDDSIAQGLRAHAPPPGRLLDLGCGTGRQAHAAARLGYSVVGIDASEVALDVAQRGPESAIFFKDDVLAPRLRGTFDVLLDRGTLHTLQLSDIDRYGEGLSRLSHEGTLLMVVHDGPSAEPSADTLRLSSAELENLLPKFTLLESCPATLRKREEGAALRSLFRPRAR